MPMACCHGVGQSFLLKKENEWEISTIFRSHACYQVIQVTGHFILQVRGFPS